MLQRLAVKQELPKAVGPWSPHIFAPRRTPRPFMQVPGGVLKPIAGLHVNRKQKYLGLLDADKAKTRHPFEELDEIDAHSDDTREAGRR